jgi:hypothetical protein
MLLRFETLKIDFFLNLLYDNFNNSFKKYRVSFTIEKDFEECDVEKVTTSDPSQNKKPFSFEQNL